MHDGAEKQVEGEAVSVNARKLGGIRRVSVG